MKLEDQKVKEKMKIWDQTSARFGLSSAGLSKT